MSITIRDLYIDARDFKGLFYEVVVNAVPIEMREKRCGTYLTSKIDFLVINNPFITYSKEIQKFMEDLVRFQKREKGLILTDKQMTNVVSLLPLKTDRKEVLVAQGQIRASEIFTLMLAFEIVKADANDEKFKKIQSVAKRFFDSFTSTYLAAIAQNERWMDKASLNMFSELENLYKTLYSETFIQ